MYWFTLACRQRPPLTSRLSGARRCEPAPDPEAPEGIRRERVERARREIAAGVYDSEEKWQIALDRLADRLEWS